jgi:hypothetical protein
MKRREFMALLGGGAVAWPLAARAQQPAIPLIGLLSSLTPSEAPRIMAAFELGLREGATADVKDAHTGRDPGFAEEALLHLFQLVGFELLRQRYGLDRDDAADFRVPAQIDDAHRALAEFLFHHLGIGITDPECDERPHIAKDRLADGKRKLIYILVGED